MRSTARLFAGRIRQAVGLLYLGAVICALIAVRLTGGGLIAYAGVFAFAIHLARQSQRVKPGDPQLALELFRSNRNAGLILFAGLALEAVVKTAAH